MPDQPKHDEPKHDAPKESKPSVEDRLTALESLFADDLAKAQATSAAEEAANGDNGDTQPTAPPS